MNLSKDILKLCHIMNTTPMFVSDIFGASPSMIEKLLLMRFQIMDGESIRDAVMRNYGKTAVEIIEKSI